jgi:glycosyltransferase involved in cell wall biosynthesis
MFDATYAEVAARRARQTRSHLFLYTPYAWEAFAASYSHSPRRVLFQYHPHADFERQVLKEDAARFSRFDFESDQQAETRSSPAAKHHRRVEDAWKHADLIVCASSFTQHTLAEAGADPNSCVVIPYGVNLPDVPEEAREEIGNAGSEFHVLFVGSGVQRKGLHHLLLAWEQAVLPSSSSLTLVCRVIDPVLERLASSTSRATLRRGVSFDTLLTLYRQSTLFAMPSLIEGFGQVYLEALSQGCPVLGTSHTCLADVGTEEDGIFLTEPGDVETLAGRLEELATVLPENRSIRIRARELARTFSWSRFRSQLSRVI